MRKDIKKDGRTYTGAVTAAEVELFLMKIGNTLPKTGELDQDALRRVSLLSYTPCTTEGGYMSTKRCKFDAKCIQIGAGR